MSEGDRSKTERLVGNERINATSRVFMNLGTALFAATAGRMYLSGDVDRTALLWLSCVVALMFSGMKVLDLLDGEKD